MRKLFAICENNSQYKLHRIRGLTRMVKVKNINAKVIFNMKLELNSYLKIQGKFQNAKEVW